MKKTILGLMAFVVLTTTACTKQDKEESQPVTAEAVIGVYTITKVEATIGGIRGEMTETYFSDNGMGQCAKDDMTTFAAGGIFNISEGTVVCDPATEESGTWAVENGALKMNGETVEVELFTARTLRIAEVYNGTDKIFITYTRK